MKRTGQVLKTAGAAAAGAAITAGSVAVVAELARGRRRR
jgi:hypothetical protein